MRKYIPHYFGLIFVFAIALSLLFRFASTWVPNADSSITSAQSSASTGSVAASLFNLHEPLAILLLQIVIVVLAAKGMGALFKYFKQPSVIGEMFAGILLGPSLFGLIEPALQTAIFPPNSLNSLKILSQIGVIIFMFAIGAELDTQVLKKKAHTAIVVSHVSIFFPLLLGAGFSISWYSDYAMNGVPFRTFALFMGIAMSITAFPVLASIIRERGMTSSSLGSTAIACAAVDDVTAWCILAGIVALARANGLAGAGMTIVLTVVYIGFMLKFVKPRIDKLTIAADANVGPMMVGIILFVFFSALITEIIGIHALFGAFLAGVTVSNNPAIRRFVTQYIEPFSTAVLLPLFFAYTGLRTQIGLLNEWHIWIDCAIIIAVATSGKLGGSAIAARFTGLGWRDSLSLGALMNTRGLMELVVLNIGYDLGILSPRIFAMMVIMALVTTSMTGPLLTLFKKSERKA